jgi:sulfite exporter TauE/SafE
LLIIIALTMPFINRDGCRKRSQKTGKWVSMFGLGVVSCLIPCPPLVAVFTTSAERGELFSGALYGFIYGLGLICSPILLAGGGLGLLSHNLRREVKGLVPLLEKGSMAVMVIIALGIMY